MSTTNRPRRFLLLGTPYLEPPRARAWNPQLGTMVTPEEADADLLSELVESITDTRGDYRCGMREIARSRRAPGQTTLAKKEMDDLWRSYRVHVAACDRWLSRLKNL